MSDDFRLYEQHELGPDGYPREWYQIPGCPTGWGIKDAVRNRAGDRCVRCGHPYQRGQHGNGEWSPCDVRCAHGGPVRIWMHSEVTGEDRWVEYEKGLVKVQNPTEARWRILTVHHLNEVKADCRWWNLCSLCQRCHLTIQGKVKMDRPYDRPHTAWFLPYVAGHYAAKYLHEELSREEVEARLEELLALELRQESLFDRSAA